jgi:hypothetical protein
MEGNDSSEKLTMSSDQRKTEDASEKNDDIREGEREKKRLMMSRKGDEEK